jgi:hypothetical protein
LPLPPVRRLVTTLTELPRFLKRREEGKMYNADKMKEREMRLIIQVVRKVAVHLGYGV